MKQIIYRILKNEEVIAFFNNEEYAQDFIDYQQTISKDIFTLEKSILDDKIESFDSQLLKE